MIEKVEPPDEGPSVRPARAVDADFGSRDRSDGDGEDTGADPAELRAEDSRELPLEDDPASDAPIAPATDGGGGRPLGQRLEALLFASGAPLSAQRLSNVAGVELPAVQAALAQLVAEWSARPGAIELVELAGGFRFMTRPQFAPDLAGLARKSTTEKLSPAALETLAVVAYRQPIGRADIEAVRGVGAGPVLRWLIERDLVRVTGRSDEPGHPLLYGTTKRFLDHFGLPSLKALPDLRDLLEPS